MTGEAGIGQAVKSHRKSRPVAQLGGGPHRHGCVVDIGVGGAKSQWVRAGMREDSPPLVRGRQRVIGDRASRCYGGGQVVCHNGACEAAYLGAQLFHDAKERGLVGGDTPGDPGNQQHDVGDSQR